MSCSHTLLDGRFATPETHSAVQLVTPGDPCYAGFSYVDSPEKLGMFYKTLSNGPKDVSKQI